MGLGVILSFSPLFSQEVFKVSRATHPISIDGKALDPDWKRTEVRTFDHFYRLEEALDKQKTSFRMLWDEDHLYVLFECEDQYITAREKMRDGQPYLDDCGEIFLIPVPENLNMHLGFEINLYKASNDFVYFNDFYQGEDVLLKSWNPDFEVEVSVDGTINDHSDRDRSWTMEMAIPLTLFSGVDQYSPVEPGNRWTFLAVRQERNDLEGDRRSTSTLFPLPAPMTTVHVPECFGLMEFIH